MSVEMLEANYSFTICLSVEEIIGRMTKFLGDNVIAATVKEIVPQLTTVLYMADCKMIITARTPTMCLVSIGHEMPSMAEEVGNAVYTHLRSFDRTIASRLSIRP